MALGTYGIVRPADVSPDDVDIILHYTASRDVTDNFLLKKLNSQSILTPYFHNSDTGGNANATLPSHTHTATVTDPGHTHGKFVGDQNIGGSGTGHSIPGNNAVAMPNAFTQVTVAISTEGSSATNANLPPYYALAYIMKA